jgi:hypothetical protein
LGGDIWKRAGGVGDFIALGAPYMDWWGMCASPNGDVYACVKNGDIFKQAHNTSTFVALSQTHRYWKGMCATPNGDVYASVEGGDIYIQTGGTGSFLPLNQTHRDYGGMAAAPNGDIYVCEFYGDVYIRSGGSGDFIGIGQPNEDWWDMAGAPNGDVYLCDSGGGYIYLYSPPYSVTYNGNGNTGGSLPSDSSHYKENDTVTVLGNTGALTKTNCIFSNWNTAANGSGTSYSQGQTFLMPASDVTLYAQWESVAPTPPPPPPPPPPPIVFDSFNIPLFDNANFSETVQLDGNNYGITLTWNGRGKFWSISIADGNGNLLRAGIRLSTFYPIKLQYRYDNRLPSGDFLLVDENSSTWSQEAGRHDFTMGRKLKLLYLSAK